MVQNCRTSDTVPNASPAMNHYPVCPLAHASSPLLTLRHLASGLPRKVLFSHAVLTVLIPYLHKRIRMYALSRAWPDAPSSDSKRRAWDWLVRLESSHATLGLFGFLTFLWDGKCDCFLMTICFVVCPNVFPMCRFRTLSDRLLGLRLVPVRSIVTRNVSYEFMNRQMVWHSFTVRYFFDKFPVVCVTSAHNCNRRSSSFSYFLSSTLGHSDENCLEYPPESIRSTFSDGLWS